MLEPQSTTRLLDDRSPDASYAIELADGRGCRITAADPSRVLIGAAPTADLQIADPAVSRRHLALDIVDGRLRLVDLGSTNGTRVGGVRVVHALLEGGETIRIGETDLAVRRVPGPPAGPPPLATRLGRVLGGSVAMRKLYPLCARIAAAEVPVLIEGETGTGKEVLAEALHELGPRKAGPFEVFDCTTMGAGVAESELFGHERGAFTGAVAARKGVFERAEGGTLLIDEIGDLDPALQAKLLRAIERREVRRVGGDRWIAVDVRVLAATRRDLDALVEHGKFRDDLLHRLAVGRIELPPLRERHGDVTLLAARFAEELGAPELAAEVLARWEAEPWPGNVRELKNAVARHVLLGDTEQPRRKRASSPPDADSLDALCVQLLAQRTPLLDARAEMLAAFHRRYVEAMLAAHNGNVTRAAAAAGIARRYFQLLRARDAT